MKFTVEREHLLKPLQQVSGPLGGRPTLPILGNLLLQVADGTLSLTGTDLEMEMVARVALVQPHEPGATTVPARKFFDICRGLPEGAEIALQLEGDRMLVRSGRSRFSLSTLPAADFPNLDDWQSEVEFTLPQATMKRLIEATQFSMAHQDVRYYLNGMLFETEGEELRTVATDGHRLAVCSMPIGVSLPGHSVIVPRKGVIELMRMLVRLTFDEVIKGMLEVNVGAVSRFCRCRNIVPARTYRRRSALWLHMSRLDRRGNVGRFSVDLRDGLRANFKTQLWGIRTAEIVQQSIDIIEVLVSYPIEHKTVWRIQSQRVIAQFRLQWADPHAEFCGW